MLVSPINSTNNNNIGFKAVIKPSESLQGSFDMMSKYAESASMKDLNSVKDFVDSLVKISETKKVPNFKIEVDRRRENYTYTKINGRRVSGGPDERNINLQDSYITAEGIKKYAAKLEDTEPSVLDDLKSQVEQAEQALSELKDRYSARLKAELEQAQEYIFGNVK